MRIFRQTVVLLRQQIEADQKKENRHEMTMDTGEYADINKCRKRKYWFKRGILCNILDIKNMKIIKTMKLSREKRGKFLRK